MEYVKVSDAVQQVYHALRTPRVDYNKDPFHNSYEEAEGMISRYIVDDPEPKSVLKGQIRIYDNGMVVMSKETYEEYEAIAINEAARHFTVDCGSCKNAGTPTYDYPCDVCVRSNYKYYEEA